VTYEDLVETESVSSLLGLLFARAHGLGDVLDSWEPDLGWLRGTR